MEPAMRRLLITALAFAPAALSLAACATSETSTAAPAGSYAAEQDRLQRECDARGGVLVPSGRYTGEAATENFCKITGPTNPALDDTVRHGVYDR
jgi:hypothetical protein